MAFRKYAKLSERIEIQTAKQGKDEFHQPTTVYETYHKCWASFEDQYLRDKVETAGTVLENTVRFVIRYDQLVPVKRSHYVLHKGIRYRIEDVSRGTYNKDFDTLICKEVD